MGIINVVWYNIAHEEADEYNDCFIVFVGLPVMEETCR